MSRIARGSSWQKFIGALAGTAAGILVVGFLSVSPVAAADDEAADKDKEEAAADVEAVTKEAAAPVAGAADAASTAVPAAPEKKDEKPQDAKQKNSFGLRRDTEVGKNEELSFLQEKVASQMSELEERMFRLSEALKGLEPENASRLLIGLKYAREELIQLQMKEVQLALGSLKYSDALVEEKQLLAKLHRLEQLLLSPDLDFQLQLERLRLMRDLLRRLDGAIKEEEREKAETDQSAEIEKQLKELREKLATLEELIQRQTTHIQANDKLRGVDADKLRGVKDSDKKPDPAAKADEKDTPAEPTLESLTEAQDVTREKTEALAKAVEPVGEAAKSMEQAVSGLKSSRLEEALPHQNKALESLQKARESLQEQEKKLEERLTEEKFAAMRKDQAGNRKTTESISETAVQLGDAGAGARTELIRAAGSMSNAEGSFGSQNASDADASQGEALASLKYAREQLAAEAEKLLNRLRAEIKKRTLEGIIQMLEGQTAIRQSTERLGPRAKEGARSVLTAIVALATAEQKLVVIGEGLTALVEETEFGIALPAALRAITDGMSEVKDRLAAADASESVVGDEKQIEEDLAALLEAMKQLPSQGDPGQANAGNAADRQRELNRLIAELKIVRMLQVRLNRDTKETDKQRPEKDLPAVLAKRIEALQDRQDDVHDVTERIAVERANELPQN